MEQEVASIAHFILAAVGEVSPYYDEIPEGFQKPAVYFPTPEITSIPDTFATYAYEYAWYIKFFHNETSLAYTLALRSLTVIMEKRNLIPLVDTEGKATQEGIRTNDPRLTHVESGVVQLEIVWRSRRAYSETPSEKMMKTIFDVHIKT